MSGAAVHLTGLTFRFGRGRPVLDGLDLTVEGGHCLVLSGVNGSGKTTLLRLVAGVLRPSGGRREVGGPIGYVAQRGDEPPPGITVRRWLAALSGPRAPEFADALAVGPLTTRLDALSRGTVSKVMLAGALGREPGVLVLDEPFAHLDPGSRHQAAALIRQAQAAGAAVLVADHGHGAELTNVCRLRLEGGRLVAADGGRCLVVLRCADGLYREHVVAVGDRDALLREALARGDQVLVVEPL